MSNEKMIANLVDKGRGNKRMVQGILTELSAPTIPFKSSRKTYNDYLTKWTCKCNLCDFKMDFIPTIEAFDQIEEHIRVSHKQIIEEAIQTQKELPIKLYIKRS